MARVGTPAWMWPNRSMTSRFTPNCPGIRKEDIQVTLEDNTLTIEGERKCEDEQRDKQFYRRERAYGTFKRSFGLGTEVDTDKIAATYKDGILTLTLPKSEAAKPRQIDVTVS